MSIKSAPEFSPGQRVQFRAYPGVPDSNEPFIKRGGVVSGPNPDRPGEMLVAADPTKEDKAAGRPGDIFSVWYVDCHGLVAGDGAPTSNATVEVEKEPAADKPVPPPAPYQFFSLIHRGPHSQAAIDLIAKLFGAEEAEAMAEHPMHLPDGTAAYGFIALEKHLDHLKGLIEGDQSAAAHLAIVPDVPEVQLEKIGNWPVLEPR
jgi:hypothetical protein